MEHGEIQDLYAIADCGILSFKTLDTPSVKKLQIPSKI